MSVDVLHRNPTWAVRIFRLHSPLRFRGLLSSVVFAFSFGERPAVAFVAAMAFSPEPGRQRFSGQAVPAGVDSQAHFPYAACQAVEMPVMVIVVRIPNYDVYPQIGIENKLNAADMPVAMPIRWGVCRRPVSYSPARPAIHVP